VKPSFGFGQQIFILRCLDVARGDRVGFQRLDLGFAARNQSIKRSRTSRRLRNCNPRSSPLGHPPRRCEHRVAALACNTGAAEGAGAEAASGLGRAFFYAGTRAILVTNWSVHSQSARELVADLFKRQADDSKLTRGEALRQAMMALADGPGYIGTVGKTEFAYAHPLFWAPYSIIGDDGAR
jgi:hypothetical protein